MKVSWIVLCFATILIGVSSLEAQCLPGLPCGTTCVPGQDVHGAFYLIAVPEHYNGRLVLWNHGYSLAPPAGLSAGDLGPTAALLRLGFAAAASSYRRDGEK